METKKKRYAESFAIPPGQGGAKPYVEMEIDGEVYTVPKAEFLPAVENYIRECNDIGEGMQEWLDNGEARQHINEVEDCLETCKMYLEDAHDAIQSLEELRRTLEGRNA